MNLYLKQKVFSWGDKFTVFDENGNDIFYVQGEVFTFGKKLHILDVNGGELCFINQRLFTFLPRFCISRNGYDIAEVVKRFTLFYQKYDVESFGWSVEGDFFEHEYSISSQDGVITAVSKKWFTWGDAYEINIAEGIDCVNVLAVVLIIDACIEISRNSSNH